MGVIEGLKFYYFTNMGYNDIPPDQDAYHSTWVDYPNRNFDPKKGHAFYQRHLRLLALAEELGYDGLAINEHHNTIFSMTPAVSVMAGALVARTSRVRILVAGVPLNLCYPNRLAEEYAMLDVLSAGRMEFAFPLGTGMEYWANAGAINPATARARFRESLDIVLKAWTQDGPQRYEGDFYTYRYLNPWPRPYQQPHPKIFVVGSGSKETVELAVEFGAGYSVVLTPIESQLRAFAYMRELAEQRGRMVEPDDLIIVCVVHVADSDEEAIRNLRPYVEKFYGWQHRVPPKFLLPPGYVSTEEFLRRVSDAALSAGHNPTWEDMVRIMRIACGSPQTVADTIVAWCEEAGCGRLNLIFELADMPEWQVVRSATLFAEEVIPRIRARAGTPSAPQVAATAR